MWSKHRLSVTAHSLDGMEARVYRPDERPDVLVTVEGVEYPAELPMWQQREDGSWWANVNGSLDGQRYVGTFSAAVVRLDERDYCARRSLS